MTYPFQKLYYSSMTFWHSSSKFEYLMLGKQDDKHCTKKWNYYWSILEDEIIIFVFNASDSKFPMHFYFIALDSATNLLCSFTHLSIKCMLSAYYMPDTKNVKTHQVWFSSFGMHWNHLEDLLKIHMPQSPSPYSVGPRVVSENLCITSSLWDPDVVWNYFLCKSI